MIKELKPQKQPNSYSCLVTCAAILLHKPVEDCFKFLGHDGTILINGKILGFTIPEIQLLAMKENYIFLETASIYEDDFGNTVCTVDWSNTLATTRGIIRYETRKGNLHALVYDGPNEIIINPKDGLIKPMPEEIEVHDFMPLLKIEKQNIGLPKCIISKVNSRNGSN